MKKNLKKKWLLLTAFVVLHHITFSQKKVIEITTKMEITASKEAVFNLLKNQDRYPEWSPFVVNDPNQNHYLTGTNGEIGSTFHWEGVAEKSKGFQILAKSIDNEYLRYNCTIIQPFKGNPVFEYSFSENNGKIEVIQDFNLHLSGFSYFMTRLFGVKNKMIASNKLGMERLKQLVEKENNLTAKASISNN